MKNIASLGKLSVILPVVVLLLLIPAAPVAAQSELEVEGEGTFTNVGPNGSLGPIPLSALGDIVEFEYDVEFVPAGFMVSVPASGDGEVEDITQGWEAELDVRCGAVVGPNNGHIAFWGTAEVNDDEGYLFFAISHDKAFPLVGDFDRFLFVLVPPGVGASLDPLACTTGLPFEWVPFADEFGGTVHTGGEPLPGLGPGTLIGEIEHELD